ncbi:MAG: fibro-slime domain-containing protein [Phycisphaerales bacterium]
MRTTSKLLLTAVLGTTTPLASAQLAGSGASGELGGGDGVYTPESIELTGVIRDFHEAHPDMQYKVSGVMKGLVEDELDAEGKPVLDEAFKAAYTGTKYPINSAETFYQWFRDVPGVNTSWLHTITLDKLEDGSYFFAREQPNSSFFPADYKGFAADGTGMNTTSAGTHNYFFTFEVEMDFTYTDPDTRDHALEFTFTGDDDVWVFINGKLACDIGGVHGQASDSVDLDAKRAELGLEVNENYKLKLFFAERHRVQSNFRIETTLSLRKSELPPTAGLFD